MEGFQLAGARAAGLPSRLGVRGTCEWRVFSFLPCGAFFRWREALKVHAPTLILKSGEFVSEEYQ